MTPFKINSVSFGIVILNYLLKQSPPRVKTFSPKKANLFGRKVIDNHICNLWCVWVDKASETSGHVFWDCTIAGKVWKKSSVDALQQNLPPPGIYGLAVVFKIQPTDGWRWTGTSYHHHCAGHSVVTLWRGHRTTLMNSKLQIWSTHRSERKSNRDGHHSSLLSTRLTLMLLFSQAQRRLVLALLPGTIQVH